MEKYIIGGAILAVVLIVLVIYRAKTKGVNKADIKIPEGFTFTGHTGCVGTRDNSLEAIDKAMEFGVDIVEFDIRYSGAEHILSHDDPVGGEATFKEALLKVKQYDGLKANIDVKEVSGIENVQPIAEEVGMLDRVFFTGIFEKDATTVAEKCPKISYYLNMKVDSPKKHTKAYLEGIIATVKKCGAVGINFHYRSLSPALAEAFHEAGFLVSVWTVNDKKSMYKVLACGVDNITTRRPDMLQKIIKEIGD